VAQAIHWFDLEGFWVEAQRVLRTGGTLAFWGYLWPEVDKDIDALLEAYRQGIANYWPKRATLLHNGYKSIQPPASMKRIESPNFWIRKDWAFEQYLAHLDSWSGTRYCREAKPDRQLSEIAAKMRSKWGGSRRPVAWPLILKAYNKQA